MYARDPRIFISYRRDDSEATGRLADDLMELFGAEQILIDVALAPGQNFVEAIDRAIEQSDAVLVVIGPDWTTISDGAGRRLDSPNDYVRLEVAAALSKEGPLVPVLVQGARFPMRIELPEELTRLADYNAVELTETRWRYDVGRLVDVLEQDGVSSRPLGRDV